MDDEKSHTEQGQIERAQRLRRVIEKLKQGSPGRDRRRLGNPRMNRSMSGRAQREGHERLGFRVESAIPLLPIPSTAIA